MSRWWAALCLVAGPVLAADESLRQQLEQRVRLAARLIGEGAVAQRIAASGNAEATAHFDEGRLHLSVAEGLLGQGDLAGARREADEALRHVAMARRLVPDAPARLAGQRQRVDQKASNLEGLIRSWRAHLGATDAADGDLVAAISLSGAARRLGDQSRYEEALQALDTAERHVLLGMNRLLHAKTLDYTPRAASPAEEFDLELARHQSLSELVPLALNELKPREDAVVLIERYRGASQALRAQARQKMSDGDPRQALADIHNASLFLLRALGAAGVSTPAPSGGEP